MALVVGQNSWATLAEADAYLSAKPGTADWFALDATPTNPGDSSKESFLITAFYWLIDDSFGLTADMTDDFVKRAQIESALFLLRYSVEYNNREALIASGVTEFQNSRWEETFGSMNKPQTVINILNGGGLGNANALVDLEDEDCQ